jgi:hypothetical protein
MSSYSRACKYCGRRINLRQMPHGQWVPFEGDQQHVCHEPPLTRAAPPAKPRTPATAAHPALPGWGERPMGSPVARQLHPD